MHLCPASRRNAHENSVLESAFEAAVSAVQSRLDGERLKLDHPPDRARQGVGKNAPIATDVFHHNDVALLAFRNLHPHPRRLVVLVYHCEKRLCLEVFSCLWSRAKIWINHPYVRFIVIFRAGCGSSKVFNTGYWDVALAGYFCVSGPRRTQWKLPHVGGAEQNKPHARRQVGPFFGGSELTACGRSMGLTLQKEVLRRAEAPPQAASERR